MAEVYISSPEYLKTVFAQNSYRKNITKTTSKIAQANNAIFAVNGDFYGARDDGYVLKNGVLYRDTAASELAEYNASIATLTVGSIMEGVLRIYGTYHAIVRTYWQQRNKIQRQHFNYSRYNRNRNR